MPKASTIQPDKNISFLFKGNPGEGKTIAASTASVLGDIWIAYFDKQSPVELFTFYHKIGRADLLDRIEYDCYSSANANEYLNKLFQMSRNPGRYVAGITDSVTNLTSAAVNWSLGFRPGHSAASRGDINLPEMDEYKAETSLVTQALDICKAIPWYNIWIAHPLSALDFKAKSSGAVESIKQKQTLVTYGSKVGSMIPGNFTEIYHFNRQIDKRTVWTDLTGDDYAKTAYNIPKSFDITNKLFFEVWRELINNSFPKQVEVKDAVNPFGESKIVDTSNRWKV